MRGLLGSKAASAIAGLTAAVEEDSETREPVELPADVDAYALPEEANE